MLQALHGAIVAAMEDTAMTLRSLILFVAIMATPATASLAETEASPIAVWKSATCQCCGKIGSNLEALDGAVEVDTAA